MHIRDFQDKHMGGLCFILGNGPGLKDINLNLLKNETTFGTNRIYLSGFQPTYYVCVNDLLIAQFEWQINTVVRSEALFIPDYKIEDPGLRSNPALVSIDTRTNFPSFQKDCTGLIWEGHTVTYVAIQLAFYMGFEEVILVGLDHFYQDYKQPNMELLSTGADPNHFSPDYFGKGVKWNAPDLRMSEFSYSLAKAEFELHDRTIINASTQTALEIFETLPFNYVMNPNPPLVSAIVSAYKSERFLKNLLVDLAKQTIYNILEIVIVCQENSWEDKFLAQFGDDPDFKSHVKIIKTLDIPSVYQAWNLGIKAASGIYLTNANTDDRHHPEAYEIMSKILETRPDIDLIYADCFVTWKENQTYDQFIQETQGKPLEAGRVEGKPGYFSWLDYNRAYLGQGCFMGPQPMWRANLHQFNGYFLDEMKNAGDYEFWLRISKEANMYHIPYPFGLYCARPDGVELGNLQQNYEEAQNAIFLHAETEFNLEDLGEYMKISTSNSWIIPEKKELVKLIKKLVKVD